MQKQKIFKGNSSFYSMFDKKCSKCKSKVKKNFDFCPFCGNNICSSDDSANYGLIGKNDFMSQPIMPFGNSIIEKMFNQTLKMLEKQMKNMNQDMRHAEEKIPINNPELNVQFFVNGKRVFPPQHQPQDKTENSKIKVNKMPQERLERFARLPKQEPNSRFRRLGNKLIYELDVPGVNGLDDILINRLENSIEVRAIAEDKTYSKILNINLPIIKYGLDNGSLIIELQAN